MSKLNDQQLDDLFRDHLMDLEKELPANSWHMLSKDVSRNNFLKFNWKSFNIFYAAGITAVAISAVTYFVISTPSAPKENPPAEKIIPILQDTVSLQQLPSMTEPEENKVLPEKSTVSKAKISIQQEPTFPSPAVAQDTIMPIVPEPVPVIKEAEPEKKEAPKPKKIITVIKRDTVRIKDTVNLKRLHW